MTVNTHYLIRTSSLQGFDRLVTELGGDPEPLLAAYGLTVGSLRCERETMNIRDLVELLETTARRLGCPEFGMRLGASQDFRMLGPLGLLLQNCRTPREALHSARSFMFFHNQSEYWDYHSHGALTALQRYENFYDITDTRQYRELALSACYQLCRTLIGPGFRGVRLDLSHAPLSSPVTYRRYFHTDVAFNQEHDILWLETDLLDAPLRNQNETLKRAAMAYVTNQGQDHELDLVQQVRVLIQQTLGAQEASLENIASLLGLNPRTLQRRLKQHGVVFKALVNDVRIKSACWYLRSSNMDITLLSEMLGYSDVSAFSHAFRNAMGVSPMTWRRALPGTAALAAEAGS